MSAEAIATTESPAASLPLRAWLALAVILVADVMDLLDSTITTIAAPSIVRDIGGGEMLVKWLVASYALAMGVALVSGGRLGDKFGRRRMFLIGIAGFTLASLGCGLAQGPTVMIVARALQGGFGALMIPQGFGVIAELFPREQMGKAFSAFGPVMGISAVGGPILAGFLIDANIAGLGWRPMFLINLILGVAGFIAARAWLPKDEGKRETIVDFLGSVLLAGGMFSLLYGMNEGSTNGWGRPPLAVIFAGLILFGAFCWRQASAETPLISRSLFRNRGFTSGLILGLVFFASVNGLCFVIALFLQNVLGKSPTGTALGMAPLCVGIVIASVVGSPLIRRLGRRLILLGLIVTIGGVGLLALLLHLSSGEWSLAVPIFLIGLGMGTCFGTIFDVALGDATPEEAGSASGALNAIQQLASGLGSAVITSIYFSGLAKGGGGRAILTSLGVVAGAMIFCCALVRLLPKRAAEGAGHGPGPALTESGQSNPGT